MKAPDLDQLFDGHPEILDAFIGALDYAFPLRAADPTQSERMNMYIAGQRSVVEWLREQQHASADQVEDEDVHGQPE